MWHGWLDHHVRYVAIALMLGATGAAGFGPSTPSYAEVWRFRAPARVTARPVVVNGAGARNTTLYLSSGVTPIDRDPSLTAVNASTGAQIWRWHSYYKDSVPRSAGVSADGQTVFIGSGTSLYALESSSGQQRWDLNMHDAISTAPTFDATRNLIFIGVGASVYAIATFAKGLVTAPPTISLFVNSRTLMGCTDPISVLSGVGSKLPHFMLTCGCAFR